MDREWEEWVEAEPVLVVNVSVMRAGIVNSIRRVNHATRKNVLNVDR